MAEWSVQDQNSTLMNSMPQNRPMPSMQSVQDEVPHRNLGQDMPQMPQTPEVQPPVKTGQTQGSQPVVRVEPRVEKESPWKDIGDWEEDDDIGPMILGVLITLVLVLAIVRGLPGTFGCIVNRFYDMYGVVAILISGGLGVLSLLVSRIVYSRWIGKDMDWSPLHFTATAVGTQVVHDFVFQFGVIKQLTRGQNTLIDLLKDYAEEGGIKIVGADAGVIAIASGLSMILKGVPEPVLPILAALGVQASSYLLQTKPANGICASH